MEIATCSGNIGMAQCFAALDAPALLCPFRDWHGDGAASGERLCLQSEALAVEITIPLFLVFRVCDVLVLLAQNPSSFGSLLSLP
ncbi:hypothetical protein [Nostoc sp.]|uniref:hypothetical protein n=1 Tax=Nostoc sp. TaxID=1180 RepID=UPI003593547C